MGIVSQKIQILKENCEDYEWYPTTPEIMEAMRKDIWAYLRKHEDYSRWRKAQLSIYERYNDNKKYEKLEIETFLDIGAGDGRRLHPAVYRLHGAAGTWRSQPFT